MSKVMLEKKKFVGVCLQFQEVVYDRHGREYDTSRQRIEAGVENLTSSSVGSRVGEREICETRKPTFSDTSLLTEPYFLQQSHTS